MEEREHKRRTEQQNKALHLWLEQCADVLNSAGIGKKAVFAVKQVDVPWSKSGVKEDLFRPIYEALTAKESTADANTVEYDRVVDVLAKHLGEHFGITLPPFPDRWGQMGQHNDA